MFFVVVNVAHCQQVGTAGSRRQDCTSNFEIKLQDTVLDADHENVIFEKIL